MLDVFRSLAVHQARFYQTFLESWGTAPGSDQIEAALAALVHDGLWLTKFPLLWTPTYGVKELDALNKAWTIGYDRDPARAVAEIAELRPRVDADVLRFLLKLNAADLQNRIEIFFGGRAMNKPLWQYLAAWFERGAVLRGRLPGPGMFDTSFS